MSRCLLVLLSLCLSLSAFAGPRSAEDLAEAERLFVEAEKHYALQEYELAIVKFQESFRLSDEPELLYNIGQCQMFLKQYSEAIQSYKSYLWLTPADNPNRELIESKILEAKRLSESSSQPVQTMPTSSASTPSGAIIIEDSPPAKGAAAPVLYGASAASLVASALTFGAALSLKGQVSDLAARSDSQLLRATIDGKIQSAGHFATASAVLLGVGLAAGIGGVVVSRNEKQSVSLSITPSGVVVGGEF